MQFTSEYFENYCKSGSYADIFAEYSEIDSCLRLIRLNKIKVKSMLVLGTATGEVLAHIHKDLGIKPKGCEISRWAYNRIPSPYRKHVVNRDMRSYLPDLAKSGVQFDFVFSNSIFYLPEEDVDGVLSAIAAISPFLHYYPMPEGDPWVQTDKPYRWWKRKMQKHGWSRTRSPYLWRRSSSP